MEKKSAKRKRQEGDPEPARTKSTSALVNQDDFHQYVNFKMLDSIGYPGAYRKFMLRRRDQGAGWAKKMNEHVAMVSHAIKELSILEQVMPCVV